jgi:F0F1-type ATP synthase epsilon subunit
MSTNHTVHCVVVTPEKTELDAQCDSMILPLFDGLFGILPGHAPMVGRLGFGLMSGLSTVASFKSLAMRFTY